jgi:4-carboxymuconolactone decarboxylase
MDLDQMFEQGMETRKKVLGKEYVENSFNNADEFSMILQKFVTTHAWGACWGREHELRLHLVGALNNGVTKNEMAEIFIQVATYAGFPAAVTAFKVAREVFKEQGV